MIDLVNLNPGDKVKRDGEIFIVRETTEDYPSQQFTSALVINDENEEVLLINKENVDTFELI